MQTLLTRFQHLACAALALLGAGGALAAHAAAPNPLVGQWRTEGGAILEAYTCGADQTCAKVVWLKKARDENGDLRLSARGTPLCGSVLLEGLDRKGETTWQGGPAYHLNSGLTGQVRIELLDENTATVRFYKGLRLFGKTEMLRREPAHARQCG